MPCRIILSTRADGRFQIRAYEKNMKQRILYKAFTLSANGEQSAITRFQGGGVETVLYVNQDILAPKIQ